MGTAGCYALKLAQLPSKGAVLRLLWGLIMERELRPKSSFLPTNYPQDKHTPASVSWPIGAMETPEFPC